MFKIGQFSRFSQVTVKTLRYYDKIGLLKPAEVDRFTGYRYYSASQLPRLNRILALKEMGLSLEQVGLLLQDELPLEQIRGMLRLKQTEIEARVQEEQERLALVEWRLKQIEQEETMPSQEVVVRKVASQTVVAVRDKVPVNAIPQLVGEVYGYLGMNNIKPAGPTLAIYYDEEFSEDSVDAEMAVAVVGPVPDGDRVRAVELPAMEEMACIVHTGTFEHLRASYHQLMGWIEANGYHMAGPIREVYVQWDEEDPTQNITEIQIPVAKLDCQEGKG
jgi:effector-binding domain-containing protein